MCLSYSDFDTLVKAYKAVQNSPFCVYSNEGPRTQNSKKRKVQCGSGVLYSVLLTPVCHHRRPSNENELHIAIRSVLSGLNELHKQGMLSFV